MQKANKSLTHQRQNWATYNQCMMYTLPIVIGHRGNPQSTNHQLTVTWCVGWCVGGVAFFIIPKILMKAEMKPSLDWLTRWSSCIGQPVSYDNNENNNYLPIYMAHIYVFLSIALYNHHGSVDVGILVVSGAVHWCALFVYSQLTCWCI